LHHYLFRKNQTELRVLDKIITGAAILQPLFTIPQVYKIWILKEASGISVFTWGSYFIFSLLWLAYGIIHKQKPIIYTYIFWIILNGLVALGAILYN
jgi:uncharacterized protein with PQ loop repeat